jgi:uncharacterized protein (DUF2225 family)
MSTKVTFADIDFEIEYSNILGMIYSVKDANFSYVSKYKCLDDFKKLK